MCVPETCAAALGPAVADLVRSAWDDQDVNSLVFLAEASAACLPFPPDAGTLRAALTAYAQRDDVPRVEKATSYLLAHLDVLAGTASPGRGIRRWSASVAVMRLRKWFLRPPKP